MREYVFTKFVGHGAFVYPGDVTDFVLWLVVRNI